MRSGRLNLGRFDSVELGWVGSSRLWSNWVSSAVLSSTPFGLVGVESDRLPSILVDQVGRLNSARFGSTELGSAALCWARMGSGRLRLTRTRRGLYLIRLLSPHKRGFCSTCTQISLGYHFICFTYFLKYLKKEVAADLYHFDSITSIFASS